MKKTLIPVEKMSKIKKAIALLQFFFFIPCMAQYWAPIHGNGFSTTDIYGNAVNVADTLAVGKCVLIDYSATWCGPCWNLHNSGILESIQANLGNQVSVLWVECEPSNTIDQIYGLTPNGTTYANATYGDWTLTADGDSVPYPIIDCSECESMIDPTGYIPSVYFVSPTGYYCQVYGEDYGFNNMTTHAVAVQKMTNLINSYPRVGIAPIVQAINMPARGQLGNAVSFAVDFISVEDATVTWTFQNGTPATATDASATVVWNTSGTFNVSVSVTNASGTITENGTITINNYVYFCDFSDPAQISSWTIIDGDGDNYAWEVMNFEGHDGFAGVLSSASYINNVGPLHPDNWIVLPAMSLPTSGNHFLSWFAKGQDASYASEHYSVYVSTTGHTVSDFTNAFFSETTTSNWAGHNVDLSAYAGQTVYIAFRHHDCTDMFWLDIDDIEIITTDTTNGVTIDTTGGVTIDTIGGVTIDTTNSFTIEPFVYYVSDSDDFTAFVIGTTESLNGNITIPSSVTKDGTTYSVIGIGMNAFTNQHEIISLVMPNTIEVIQYRAFYGCNNMASITIGRGTQYISDNAFAGCNITTLNYKADSCVNGGTSAICGTHVSTLNIGSHVRYIPNYAFNGCSGLTSVNIPASVRSIGNSAFSSTGLTEISLGNGLETIGASAFAGTPLAWVVIPNSVTSIGSHAFKDCNSMTGVSLSTGLTSISDGTFSGCSALNAISLDTNIRYIGDHAFYGCEGLTSVSIPNNVYGVGSSAFKNCTGLTTVTIGSGVETLGDGDFYGCNAITTINYNAEECLNAVSTFQGISSLTTLNIGDNVRYIPSGMFKECTGLVTVNIPDAVTEMGSSAFRGCANLTSATLGSGLTTISSSCFEDCLRLMNVRLGDALSSIGADAFRNCGIVGELVIPQSVTTIECYAFENCYGINTITALGRVAPVLENCSHTYDGPSQGPFNGVDSNIVVNVPCGSTNMYAGRWPQFHNFSEMPFLFNAISEDISKGTVTVEQEPTCDDPYAVIHATPNAGYHFDHWSDGSTSNPYSYTATGSVTLIAYFAENVGIDDVEDNSIRVTVENGRIVVYGDSEITVRVYDMMGRMVAMAKVGEAMPPVPNGVYIVRVGEAAAKKMVVVR